MVMRANKTICDRSVGAVRSEMKKKTDKKLRDVVASLRSNRCSEYPQSD